MTYLVKMLYREYVAQSHGATDAQAIERILADSKTFREAPASQVSVTVFQEYTNGLSLSYVTTLQRYMEDTN